MEIGGAQAQGVSVFGAGVGGGNPALITFDADGMSDDEMRGVAAEFGHESGFVVAAPAGSGCDFGLRFWVPKHEMEMCGHATVGAVWLLDRLGRIAGDEVAIWTASGVVRARLDAGREVEVSQPAGEVEAVDAVPEVLAVLGISTDDLAPLPVLNARTSRVKTLVPVWDVATLDALRPDYDRIEQLCHRIASTGLYPFAASDLSNRVFDARQFPASSGYPEDAATGIAAAALAFGLLEYNLVQDVGQAIVIRQGRAMGRPSEIVLRFDLSSGGIWLGGRVELGQKT